MTTALAGRRRRLLDLGEVEGEILVFGGPYSNLEATRAVLAAAKRRGIPPGRVFCTGDVVAYCADPDATVQAVREAGIQVIMGNCEESLGQGAADCGCGFAAGSACDRLSAEWYGYAAAQLSVEARGWMRLLPHQLAFTLADRRLTVIHGGASRINRYLFASDPAADKLEELALCGGDGIIAGHCGLPFTQILGGRLWHNAGAVGVPANDGTTRTWYSILTPVGPAVRIAHHPLDYDHAAAAAKMRRRGLPEAYACSLETGLWPNNDILPPSETAAQGLPLSPASLIWPETGAHAAAS